MNPMRLNLDKLDNHLKKLQEIRRIAADPEMMQLLSEFLGREEEIRQKPDETALPEPSAQAAPPLNETPVQRDAVSEVVKEVLQRSEHTGVNNSIGLWNRRKG